MHTGGEPSTTERTPLLSTTHDADCCPDRDGPPVDRKPPPVPWTYHAVTLAFVLLSLLLCLVVTIVFTAHSYVAPLLRTDPSVLAQRSITFQGPSRFNILNFTSDGLWCEVEGKAAVDVTRALGLQSGRLTDKLVGWAVRKVGSITVSTSDVRVHSDDNVMLATLDLPSIVLPLSTTPSPSLRNITMQILVRPASNIQDITEFAAHSWEDGHIKLKIYTSRGIVFGGGRVDSWRSHLRIEKHDIRSTFKVDVPPLPGSPPSPPNEPRPIPDLAKLVYLESYRVIPPPPTLGVAGTATLPNPLPSLLHGAIALSLPFVISLPAVNSEASMRIARVETAPLSFTAPNISLAISGHVLPLPSSSDSIAPVSRFASDFLAGRASPVLITTDFLRDLGMVEELTVQSEFPAAARQPEILRDVQISNMRVTLRGEQILASAYVRAHIVLPDTLAAVRVNATRVWPDLLVYDGSPPPFWPFEDPKAGPHSGALYDEADSEPDPMPIPKPLPPNAFARIRPDSWVIAHTEPLDPIDGKNQGVWVHAQVSDVPLDVLPGRDAELRAFIRKVIFNVGGAQAGIAGITAVAARVGGLVVGSQESGELELFGLPLRGETRVGKKNLHEPGWGIPLPKNPLPLPTIPDLPTIPTPVAVPTSLPSPTPTLPPAVEVPSPQSTPELEHMGDDDDGENIDDDDDDDDDDDWLTHSGGSSIPEASYGEQNSEELWQVGVAY